MFFRQNFQIETGNKKQSPPFSPLSMGSHQKQGQKLVLSDALAVQSQGPKVLSAKVVFGSQQMFWDLKECFGISKMYWQLESQKKLTLLTLLKLFRSCHC